MIRFRKGVSHRDEDIAQVSRPEIDFKNDEVEPNVSSTSLDKGKWKSVPILHEWWDTPVRFKRRELDDHECDLINVSITRIIKTYQPVVKCHIYMNTSRT